MDLYLIKAGKAMLDDLYVLNNFGYEFVVEDGKITTILKEN